MGPLQGNLRQTYGCTLRGEGGAVRRGPGFRGRLGPLPAPKPLIRLAIANSAARSGQHASTPPRKLSTIPCDMPPDSIAGEDHRASMAGEPIVDAQPKGFERRR